MFMSLITRLRHRHETLRTLDAMLARADDHLLEDMGLTREDVRVLRQEVPGLLTLPGAPPKGLRLLGA